MKNENNFDFLRLLAALLVFISHQHVLAGRVDIPLPLVESSGKLGVCIFFAISGYLTAESWRRDPDIFRFAIKRILRIWPGLIVVTIFAALVIGPAVTSMDVKSYFTDPGFHRYFNILWLNISDALPGVFQTNPHPNAVNGSLWTIPIEVFWYAMLGILGILRITKLRGLFIIWHIVVVLLLMNLQVITPKNISFIDFGLFFCQGICLSAGRMYWLAYRKHVFFIVFLLAVIYHATGFSNLAVWIFLPCAVVMFGTSSTPFVRRFGRYGDFSYGAYLYAFPVQQAMVLAIGPSANYALLFSISLLVTLFLAYLSWHLVERPALRLKSRFQRVSGFMNLR